MFRVIMLFGNPGAGKGTQKEKLKNFFRFQGILCRVIDVGSYLRNVVEEHRDARIVRPLLRMMERGDPVPAAFPINALIETALKIKNEECSCIITDGIGRRLREIKIAIELLLEIPQSQITAIVINVPEGVAKNRLFSRGRKDDQNNAITQRIGLYYDAEEGTQAAIHYLRGHPSIEVYEVCGSEDPETVHKNILECLSI